MASLKQLDERRYKNYGLKRISAGWKKGVQSKDAPCSEKDPPALGASVCDARSGRIGKGNSSTVMRRMEKKTLRMHADGLKGRCIIAPKYARRVPADASERVYGRDRTDPSERASVR